MAIDGKWVKGRTELILGTIIPYDAEWREGRSVVEHEYVASSIGRISRSRNLDGLGGQGQQTFNPMN